MDTKDDASIRLARLPDGQLVNLEEVHSDGYATVRRVGGEWAGELAVCLISKLDGLAPGSSLKKCS